MKEIIIPIIEAVQYRGNPRNGYEKRIVPLADLGEGYFLNERGDLFKVGPESELAALTDDFLSPNLDEEDEDQKVDFYRVPNGSTIPSNVFDLRNAMLGENQ